MKREKKTNPGTVLNISSLVGLEALLFMMKIVLCSIKKGVKYLLSPGTKRMSKTGTTTFSCALGSHPATNCTATVTALKYHLNQFLPSSKTLTNPV